MQTTMYERKPLVVEAVRVTAENLYEVAQWCGGEIHKALPSDQKFIEVAVLHPLHKKQTRANVGDWVLKSDQGFKIYADTAFQKGFHIAGTLYGAEDVADNKTMVQALVEKTVLGAPEIDDELRGRV